MPTAEPGDVQRSGRHPLHRRQAHVPQAHQPFCPGAAGSGAVRAVRQVHAVLQPDRRRSLHRPRRTRRPAAGRHRRRHTVRLLLLGQHRADLSGRRAHRYRVPIPCQALRPGVLTERVRTLRVGMCAAHRSPPRTGAAPLGGRRPGSQRRVELRQGPLGVRLRRPGRPHRHAADTRRRRRAAPGVVVGSRRSGDPRTRRGRGARRCSRRRTGHARRCLLLRQVRQNRARHQRRRLPQPSPLGRGGPVPRGRRRRTAVDRDVRRPRGGARGTAGRARTRGRVTDRVFEAAKGIPQTRVQGQLHRAVRHPWPREDGWHPDRRRARCRGGRPRRARRRPGTGNGRPGR